MSEVQQITAPVTLEHRALEQVFHQLFERRYRTRLVGGGQEPLYRPAAAGECHTIIYTRDYAASALHEVAHWCVAGADRRLREDYGYWYAPDGRSVDQQQLFEQVEVKPQAFEWIFSVAAGRTFRVSADNLAAGLGASETFKDAIHQQVLVYCAHGLPERAALFTQALAARSGVSAPLTAAYYRREAL